MFQFETGEAIREQLRQILLGELRQALLYHHNLDLRVAFGDRIRLSGAVVALGGEAELADQRFTIDHLRLGFGGTTILDPELDFRATRSGPPLRSM